MKKKDNKNQEIKSSSEDILRLNFSVGDVPSLDPQELGLGGRGVLLGKWLFEGLTRLNLKKEYEFAGAKSVDISPNQTRYTFTLRSNWYSDGTPVKASDYERCWKKILAPESKCPKAHLLYCIKNAKNAKQGKIPLSSVGIRALDSQTLSLELDYPVPSLLGMLSMPLFAPFKVGKDGFLGSGPYRLDEWKKNDFLRLSKNPFFWDKDHIHIQNVKVSTIQDGTTAFSLYEKGELDWIGDPISFLPTDILSSQINQKKFFKETGSAYPFWLYINTHHPHLSSPLIRKALSCVIDRNEIVEHIFLGDEPLLTPLPSCLSLSNSPSINNNLIEGRELFEKGLRELKLTVKTFPRLKLSGCSSAKHRKLIEYLKEKWERAFGIRVDLSIQDWPAFYQSLQKGSYQIGGGFFGGDYYDHLAYLELLSCETNFSKWHHYQYREILEQARRSADLATRMKLLKEAEKILMEEVPIVWILNRVQQYSHRPDLRGICFDHRGAFDLRWAYFENKRNENQRFHSDQ